MNWTLLMAALGLSGSLRVGYWDSTRDLDAVKPEFGTIGWLKATRSIGTAGSYFIEGWSSLRGPSDSTRSLGELREAYVDLRLGPVDVRVGRQIVAWGRADGINPTDHVTPRDMSVLVPDDFDRRLGTTGVRASAYLGDVSLSALWFPEFRAHRISLPAPPPGVTFRERFDQWPGETWGVRVERTGGAVDWSASFLRGQDLNPDLAVASTSTGAFVDLKHHRIWMAGVDAAANAGRYGLRAEAAYVGTEDDDGDDPFTKNHYIMAVVGGDRAFAEHLNINLQYIGRYVVDFRETQVGGTLGAAIARQNAILNSQVARVQHGASSRVKYSWLHETLEAEVAGVVYFGPRGQATVPKVSYAITDHWKVVAGGEIYRGEDTAVFGMLRPNSVAFAEFRFSF